LFLRAVAVSISNGYHAISDLVAAQFRYAGSSAPWVSRSS